MLCGVPVFPTITIFAAIFDFDGPASLAAGIVKLLIFIFLVVFIIALITGMTRRSRTGM